MDKQPLLTRRDWTVIIVAAFFVGAIFAGGMKQQSIAAGQRSYDNQRTQNSVKKINAKQDANAEMLRAICWELKIDTTGLLAFNTRYMDSLERVEIVPLKKGAD